MAKYTGPVCKICRREGEKLFLKGQRCYTPKCAFERRSYPPGEHGRQAMWRRRRVSEYWKQLREKQKTRRVYNVTERQFRRYYRKAQQQRGLTGQALSDSPNSGHEIAGNVSDIPSLVVGLGFLGLRRHLNGLVVYFRC